jgi:uncharacterized protein YacL
MGFPCDSLARFLYFTLMNTPWSIRVVRVLFFLLCLGLGMIIALGFQQQAWAGALIGMGFGGCMILLDASLGKFSFRHFSYAVFGLLIGLFGAWLITQVGIFEMAWFQSIRDGDTLRESLRVCIYATLAFLGITLALRSDRDEFAFVIPYVRFRRDASEGEPMLLDTNIVIDGRIPTIYKTGFLNGTLVIPRLVLDELQRLADSRDAIKSERGKRGLLILQQMREMSDLDLTIHEDVSDGSLPVDTRLVNLARELNARLLTNDENLAKVARLRGITVLSLNELSHSLERQLCVGDELEISLVKPGKDKHQAVGYLPDGAMVVVNQAGTLIGQSARVLITGTTQTSAGCLVFADLPVQLQPPSNR